jgi:uncharacterized Zn finger protein
MSWFQFRPYVSVAERRRNAQKHVAKLAKQGKVIQPVELKGRTIASSFWGKSWCENLEAYSDFANRLPRGRTYVRNGSVAHLEVRAGEIEAIVSGSELYKVRIGISAAQPAKWKALCRECAGGIGSLIELIQGRFSDQVMGILTNPQTGLFPSPKEIKMQCSCPDVATMCKHVAAVLYGVGARLDSSPEMLFLLRSVDHQELISQAAGAADLATKATGTEAGIADADLGDVFGIELDSTSPAAAPSAQAKATKPKAKGKTKPRRATAKPKRSSRRKP